MKYKCFCGCCGYHFESDTPLKDADGISNDIWCPECGAWEIYPGTIEGAAESVRNEIAYQAEIEAYEAVE